MTALDQLDGWDVPTRPPRCSTPAGSSTERGATDRAFRLASVSKVLAAIAVHIAVEEGTIALDDDAGPEGSTVRHLLAHASGLAPDGDAVPARPARARRRIYSNIGFEVLAEHIASARRHAVRAVRRGWPSSTRSASTGTDVAGSPAHGHHSSVADLCVRPRGRCVGHELLAATHRRRDDDAGLPRPRRRPARLRQAGPEPVGPRRRGPGPQAPALDLARQQPAHLGPLRAGGHVRVVRSRCRPIGLVVLTDRDFGPWAVDAWPTARHRSARRARLTQETCSHARRHHPLPHRRPTRRRSTTSGAGSTPPAGPRPNRSTTGRRASRCLRPGHRAAYWADEYDWPARAERLNRFPQFTTEIDGVDIHFIHVRSPHDDALPLVITHGWPGRSPSSRTSSARSPTRRPTAATRRDAFHVVCPSIPGFGFSGKPTETGWGVERIADVVGRADGPPRLRPLRRPGRRLGIDGHDVHRHPEPRALRGHPPQHAAGIPPTPRR